MAKKSEMIGFKTTPKIRKALEEIAESRFSVDTHKRGVGIEWLTMQPFKEKMKKAAIGAVLICTVPGGLFHFLEP